MSLFSRSVLRAHPSVAQIILNSPNTPVGRITDEFDRELKQFFENSKSTSDLVSRLQDHLESHHSTTSRIRAKMKSVARLLALMRSVRKQRDSEVHVTPAPQQASSPEGRYTQAAEADFVTEKRRPPQVLTKQ